MANKLVLIESPYAASGGFTVEQHVNYAEAAMIDCFSRGEAPFASHLLYTKVLNDLNPEEREIGMRGGWLWGRYADLVAVYIDFGVSPGMKRGITNARNLGKPIEYRRIQGFEHVKTPRENKQAPSPSWGEHANREGA